MTQKVLLDEEWWSKLNSHAASGATTELCDPSGRTRGYFVPADPGAPAGPLQEERDHLRACLDRLRARLEEALRVKLADDTALERALQELLVEHDAYRKAVYAWVAKEGPSYEGLTREQLEAECTVSMAEILADLAVST